MHKTKILITCPKGMPPLLKQELQALQFPILSETVAGVETEGVFNVLGYDGYQPSGRATRITIRHNLAIGTGFFLMAGSEVGTLTLDHNTVDQGGSFAVLYKGDVWITGTSAPRPAQYAVETLSITNMLANHNEYGFFGDEIGIGIPALTGLTRTYHWTHNVLAGGTGYAYPPVTWQPTRAEHRANFNADYSRTASGTYRGAGNDGGDLGAALSGSPPPVPSRGQPRTSSSADSHALSP
jgi:hypothetical protein